ncbi:hypothetical protein PsYK624_157410 [Phanerochaete sordida]|uniref:Uncharacterized protein n=1 Tax=Phanerochaete sordida TaxID=48140 RepID=A0A9P3LML4_9APHY|nr:hypothetical protein PsYK624_157410 [Phanerochaete sordida]
MAPKRKSDANATTAAPAKKTKTAPATATAPAAKPSTVDATTSTDVPNEKPASTKNISKTATTPVKPLDPAPPPSPPPAPHFSGKFDVYSTKLPFLQREYLPEGASKPNFAAVHSKILFYQAKPDFSLRIVLDGDAGRFACSQVVNPISDEELEPIRLRGSAESVAFDAREAAHKSTVGAGPGYAARMALDTAHTGCGMVKSGKGTLKMRRVWEEDGKELFEGYWDFDVTYGPTLRRKGFGGGDTYAGAFWAVRALKDAEGEEIGIDL